MLYFVSLCCAVLIFNELFLPSKMHMLMPAMVSRKTRKISGIPIVVVVLLVLGLR